MPDPAITELTELNAEKVSGVTSPANGTPWLLLKAQDTDLVKACGQDTCILCADALEKGKLTTESRHELPDSDFALPGRRYPIPDESHARNALARAAQHATPEEQATIRRKVHERYPDIEISKEDGSVEKSPGVPDEATETPTEGGHFAGSGMSGVTGPATDGVKPPVDPADSLGGESPYIIPAEHAAKDGWLSFPNMGESDATPGSPAWESYDSATLDSVATGLAAATRAVQAIAQREATEAIAGDASDWFDAYDLGCAADDINHALGLVARLAYHEGAAAKQGATEGETPIQVAIRDLTKALGGTESEEIMSTVTKEEVTDLVKGAIRDAFAEQMQAIDTARRQAKKAAKKAAKKLQAAPAAKNANNNGDITEGEMASQINGEHPAEDVGAPGHSVDSQYINKSGETPAETNTAELAKQVAEMSERLEKALSRPSSGGPVLDGLYRGAGAANEGRLDSGLSKSQEDADIERMEKELEEAKDPALKDSIGYALTLAKLKRAHTQGM